jgi:hypothetical protein
MPHKYEYENGESFIGFYGDDSNSFICKDSSMEECEDIEMRKEELHDMRTYESADEEWEKTQEFLEWAKEQQRVKTTYTYYLLTNKIYNKHV